jgi:tripartite-type tricarboxylate transporter receptor subunit TctC
MPAPNAVALSRAAQNTIIVDPGEMPMTLLFRLLGALAIAGACAYAPGAAAQQYPSKPIRIIVPFAVGGGADTVTRLALPGIQKALGGATIIVENRPGAGTVIGTEAAARATPDGYTLLVTLDQTMTMNQFLYDKLPYNPERDFVPVSLLARSPLLYVSNPQVPAKTLPEFIEYAKANAGKLNMGSGAISAQVVAEKMMERTGARMVFIPYAGGAPALAALLNNEISFVIADIATFRAATLDGRLRGLAVSTGNRSPQLPDVPTLKEVGFPDLESTSFWAIWAPTGTPPEIVKIVNAAVVQALADKEINARVAAIGTEPASSTPEELDAMVKEAAAIWGPVIKQGGIKAN